MDWALHYNRLIERARSRELLGYVERHHVVPKCLGGGKDRVRLTAREHYVAHQLLLKMHPGNDSLVWAAINLTGKNQFQVRDNKPWTWLRRKLGEAVSRMKTGTKHSHEAKAKMRAAKLGVKRGSHSAETRDKISLGNLGKPKSAEHRASLSKAKSGKPFHWSPEHRAAHAIAMKALGAARRQKDLHSGGV